jgi:hypothetical protein
MTEGVGRWSQVWHIGKQKSSDFCEAALEADLRAFGTIVATHVRYVCEHR